mgnify:CR=1 FL=1
MYQHELRIIDLMFEKGPIRVVEKQELIDFVEDRINVVLRRLNMNPLFDREPGLISGWFYDQLNTVKVPDFFAGTQIQYTRNWNRHTLKFQRELQNEY